ncbi:MAG: imidazole glycerol phosphate synthase subunit HisH [Candidatus Saccharibacteria bacterium]
MKVLIIDYGAGNLGSVRRAVIECGADAYISDDAKEMKNAVRVILPGVGAFSEVMARLREHGWVDTIREEINKYQIPFLGICLGMQLLAQSGCEGGQTEGLGLIPGQVIPLVPEPGEKIPHVGWNEVYKANSCSIFDNIPDGTDYYFVHSYHFQAEHCEDIIAKTPYGGGFVSAVRNGSVIGVQFHPEKSQRPGFQLLRNFLKI